MDSFKIDIFSAVTTESFVFINFFPKKKLFPTQEIRLKTDGFASTKSLV